MNPNKKEMLKVGKEFSEFKEKISKIGKKLKLMSKEISSEFINIQNELEKAMAPIIDAIKDLPTELEYSQKNYLFDNGWYISYDMSISDVKLMAELKRKNKIQDLEILLLNHAKNLIPEIKKKIHLEFPDREKIISDAISAHDEKRFTLSIPIFLIQAEGICREILETSPYFTRGKKGENIIKKKIEEVLNRYSVKGIRPKFDSITNIFLNHLLNETEITKKTNGISVKSQGVHRQSIIHGWNINYPNEKNSLKAICFLNYIICLKLIFENMNNFMKEISKKL